MPRLPPHTGLIGGAGGAGVVSQALTWFSALAYAMLLTGGGADGRNWSPLVSRNGVIEPQLVKTGAGEVGRGGAIVTRLGACGRGGGVAAEPSAARSPMSNWRSLLTPTSTAELTTTSASHYGRKLCSTPS